MPRRPLDDESRALFLAAAAGARPLQSDRVHHEQPPPPAIPRQHHADEQAALAATLHPDALQLALEGDDKEAWLRPGVAAKTLRDLRRGRWLVQAHVDLHGMRRDEALRHTALFLAECIKRRHRCVRIVHGKGLGSPGRRPVLKRLLPGWLSQRREVLAWCLARPGDGGGGALLVLLHNERRSVGDADN